MIELLARHALADRVAFGALGERSAADLLRDAGAVARALPDAEPGALALIGVRRDRYAFAAALLGAWARGRDVILPAVDVSREQFLALAQQPGVSAVLHDTLSSAALPIARLLADARPEHALGPDALQGESLLQLHGHRASAAGPRVLRRSQLLAEAARLGIGLQLPERAAYLPTCLPETRHALLLSILWPLLSGGAFVRDDPRAPDAWDSLLTHAPSGPRVLVSVPAQLRALARAASAPLAGLTHAISCAAPLPQEAFKALEAWPQLRVQDLYVSEASGPLGVRGAPEEGFRPLPDALPPQPTAASFALDASGTFRAPERWSGFEERIAWLPGVSDAALLPLPDGRCRLAVIGNAVAPDALPRELRLAELRVYAPGTEPADPAGVASFSGGQRSLRRDGAGRHDRTGLLRLFGLSAAGEPLEAELRFGPSTERDGKHVTAVDVPRAYVYFAGHFPGYPLLPGAAQLSEMVLPCVRRARPGLGRLVRMARLKFQERIMPGDHIEVVLSFPADSTQLDFSLLRAGSVCAAGRLGFAPAAGVEAAR